MSATTSPKRKRRPRIALSAPVSSSTSASSSSSSSASTASVNDAAREIMLAEHLKRLIDRQRHALSRMTDIWVPAISRFWFNGEQLPLFVESQACWWFRGSGEQVHRPAKNRWRGPIPTSPRWCYMIDQVCLAHAVKLDWTDVTTASLATIFDAWQNDSALKKTPGLGECMTECAPRRKPQRDELDRITLHVWNLRQLIEAHVASHCQQDARQLAYQEKGFVAVPPLRLSPRDCFPVTEHEAAVLQRRPYFASLLHHEFMQQQQQQQQQRQQQAEKEQMQPPAAQVEMILSPPAAP